MIRRPWRVAAAVVSVACVTSIAVGGTAGADNETGHATGIDALVETLLTTQQVGPTPTAQFPPGGSDSLLEVTIPAVLSTGVLNVSSVGGSVNSAASVVTVDVLGTVTADAITSECTADGSDASGTAGLANASIAATPVDANPPPNTTVPVPLLGQVVLNEQERNSSGIVVRSVHISIDTPLGVVTDVIISESACFTGVEAAAASATSGTPNLTG
jgi:hypothetical protein